MFGVNLKHHLNDVPFHQITWRQADSEMQPTSQDRAYCSSVETDAYCSSGLGQGELDISLHCGESIEDARSRYAHCTKSENGAFCGSLFHLNRHRQQYIEGNCSGALTSNTCPSQCRTHLEDFKSKFGCCINVYLNSSSSTRLSVNYRLWNLCGVPLPAMDCQNHGLTFDVPPNEQNCTRDELSQLYSALLCEPNIVQPYINDLLKDNRCSQIYLNCTKNLINSCSINPEGEFCALQIGEFVVIMFCRIMTIFQCLTHIVILMLPMSKTLSAGQLAKVSLWRSKMP